MPSRLLAALAIFFAIVLHVPCACGQTLASAVTDRAGVLDPGTQEVVKMHLEAIRPTAQVAALLVRSTGGQPIEDFSLHEAEQWKGGNEGADDGALVVLAIDDRRSRIEVGYGLEPTLTDARCKRILDDAKPALQAGDYGRALVGVVDEIALGAAPSKANLPTPIAAPTSIPSRVPAHGYTYVPPRTVVPPPTLGPFCLDPYDCNDPERCDSSTHRCARASAGGRRCAPRQRDWRKRGRPERGACRRRESRGVEKRRYDEAASRYNATAASLPGSCR